MNVDNKMLLLISPYGMTRLEELWTFCVKELDIVQSKNVIISAMLIRKHFDYLPKEQLNRVVSEWVGSQIDAFIINTPSNENIKKLREYEKEALVYLSSTRAERDLNLWFQEYLI